MTISRSAFVLVTFSKQRFIFAHGFKRMSSLRTGMSWHRTEYICRGRSLKGQFLTSWWKVECWIGTRGKSNYQRHAHVSPPQTAVPAGYQVLKTKTLEIFQIKNH